MHANFSPTLGGYSGQGAFRYWCQNVLPLTFDDSISYMELLAKVVTYLNHTIDDVATAEDNIDKLNTAFNQLQDYVNTYFDNLDLESTIDTVLDNWASDGRLGTVVEPFVRDEVSEEIGDVVAAQLADVVALQISAVVASQLADVVASQIHPIVQEDVTTWLNTYVTPVGSAVVVDSSLTVEGAAADAKVVGDDFSNTALYKRYLTSSNDVLALPIGVYAIPNTNKPTNLPSNFPSNEVGIVYVMDKAGTNDAPLVRLCFSAYSRKMWHYTGYGWEEILTKTATENLINTAVANVLEYKGYLTSEDDSTLVNMGSYGVSAITTNRPINLPSSFPDNEAGVLVVLDKSSTYSTGVERLLFANYSRRMWYYTGYTWEEILSKTIIDSMFATAVNNVYKNMYANFGEDYAKNNQNNYTKGSSISVTGIQYKFLDSNGPRDISESYPTWYISEPIDVTPNTFYYVTASAQYTHVLYTIMDSENNVIYYETMVGNDVVRIVDKFIYTPANASKIQLASVDGEAGLGVKNAVNDFIWSNIKWACMGDSLTAVNDRTSVHYFDYISYKTGIKITNLGAGGTGFMKDYAGSPAYMDRVDTIPLDSDVITIMGSGNDLSLPLGTPSDNTNATICGCINITIQRIFARKVTYNLGIITPCPWQGYNPADDTNAMAKYSEAIVQICKNWGIPCLDLYHCSNMRPWESAFRAACYTHDGGGGVHPDETGHKIIATKIEAFMNMLLLR